VVSKNLIFVATAVPVGRTEPIRPLVSAERLRPRTDGSPIERARRSRTNDVTRGAEPPPGRYQFKLLAIDRANGTVRWSTVLCDETPHEGHSRETGFASASPIVDGNHVYAYFGSRGLYCLDLEGKVVWSKRLGQMKIRNTFGEGSSPVLHGNTLVVQWDHEEEDFILAFDAASGRELWRTRRDEPTSWSSPAIVELADRVEVVAAAYRQICGYDLRTGREIWHCTGLTENVIPTPVVGKGLIYCTSGFRGASMLAIRTGRSGDLTSTDGIAWRLRRGTPYVPTPVLAEDRLYFYSGNVGILSCVDATTGELVYEGQRLGELGDVFASPVAANGRVYLFGRNGSTLVIKMGDTFETVAYNELDDHFDASPALVGRDLIVRGEQFLYCLSNR